MMSWVFPIYCFCIVDISVQALALENGLSIVDFSLEAGTVLPFWVCMVLSTAAFWSGTGTSRHCNQ